jgi:hypothetical protein
MKRIALWMLAACISEFAVAGESVKDQLPTASQIIEKNIVARGGLESWRKIQTMVWIGHIERSAGSAPSLQFILEMKRPNKTHFVVKAPNQLSERMYDGAQGWKQHPAKNGKPELLPYSDDELSYARDGQGIDGTLIDYQAKGYVISMAGVDTVDGHEAYRLSVKLPSGVSHSVWIDAQTFLDIKYDRESRSESGRSNTVSVFFRDYRKVDGLQIPYTIESSTSFGKAVDKMIIDKILLNPPLEDRMFAKPSAPGRRSGVLIDATPQREFQQTIPPPSGTMGVPRVNSLPQSNSAVAQ